MKKHLKDNPTLYPIHQEKLGYFCRHINSGYKTYDQNKNEGAGHKKIEDFAKEIIAIHNKKFNSYTHDFKLNYYKQPQYLTKIVGDYSASLVSKNDPTHIFTFVNPVDDARIDRIKEIINGYYVLINNTKTDDLKKAYLQRLILQMVSGIHLLSVHLYSDSFIIWRSLIESISYYKIISISDQKTANLFMTRRDDTAKIIGLVPASKAEMVSISSQIENRKMGKSASWWEKQRFSWAKKIIAKGDPSAKLLMERVNLGKYYPHYQVASLFTHEYMLSENDFKEIAFMDYLINLYWRALEEIKEEIKTQFELSDQSLSTIKKHEETIRKLLKASREDFHRFSEIISD
ncbi:MAG: DUF5677 domain-containing protein [Acholeplasmataceae bacterium]